LGARKGVGAVCGVILVNSLPGSGNRYQQSDLSACRADNSYAGKGKDQRHLILIAQWMRDVKCDAHCRFRLRPARAAQPLLRNLVTLASVRLGHALVKAVPYTQNATQLCFACLVPSRATPLRCV
jgi:hypothetical protein